MADMFRWMRKYHTIFVTGPQRSGTTIAARMIADDTGHGFVNEKQFGVSNTALFRRLLHERKQRPRVIQCPAMFVECLKYCDKAGYLIVFMMRDIKDIHASEDRIAWGVDAKLRELDRLGQDGDPAHLKQQIWSTLTWANCFTLHYGLLRSHPLWLDDRDGFHAHQTQHDEP